MSGYTLRAMSPEERDWVGKRARAPLDPDTRYSLPDLIPPLFFAGCLSAVLSIPLAFFAGIWRAVPLKPIALSLLVCAYVVMAVVWFREKWSQRRAQRKDRENLAKNLEGGQVEVARFRPVEVVTSRVVESEEEPNTWESWGAFVFRLGQSEAVALFDISEGTGGWPNTEFEVIRLPHSKLVYKIVGYGRFLEPALKTDEWILDDSITDGEVFEADWESFLRSRTGALRRCG